MKNRWFIFIWAVLCMTVAQAQEFDFILKPRTIPGLAGIQSYARGTWEGNWIIIGGRLDGLHLRMPFAAFDEDGHNTQIFLVFPDENKVIKRSLSELPKPLQEQLSSTNMQFIQEGKYLYLTGGYGHSNIAGDHVTYSNLTAVDQEKLSQAMIGGTSLAPAFRQITDSYFAVTGGYLGRINDHFYLVGGQRFMGRYNPMGPNHGPGFVQEYTNAIRKFKITDDGQNLAISDKSTFTSAALLHRRDYNMVPQVMPDGTEGLTAFSGVFRTDADLPFLDCVNINEAGFSLQPDFQQLYNHYHCAHIPLYDSLDNVMHNVFFGGIAQYYESNGMLIKDDNVPFVRTIADVVRSADGKMKEVKLPSEMPGYLGSGAEFIPLSGVPRYQNEVLKFHQLQGDTVMVGYIFGGIASTARNIFFTNTGTESQASPTLYEVYLLRTKPSSAFDRGGNNYGLRIIPNPVDEVLAVAFSVVAQNNLTLTITDASGRIVFTDTLIGINPGNHLYRKPGSRLPSGSYVVTISNGAISASVRFLQQ